LTGFETSLLASQPPKIPGSRTGSGRRKPCRGERNFWMQRREAKSGGKDRKCHRRPNERNDTGENPHRNGLSRVGAGICGFVGLDGGAGSRIRTGLPCEFPANSEFYRENCDFGVWKPAP